MREHYGSAGLRRADLAPDPIAQFQRWFDEWLSTDPYDANAVIAATADTGGRPSARAVLLKGLDERGFAFHTNRRSAKARDLEASGRAALCFLWHPLERQVRVVGLAEHLPEDESDAYFDSRPRGAQIGAWASPQSDVIDDRAALEGLIAAAETRFADNSGVGSSGVGTDGVGTDGVGKGGVGTDGVGTDGVDNSGGGRIPRPAHWGGYLVRPLSVEFWQGRRDRLHDRLRYRRPAGESALPTGQSNWTIERLAP